MARGQQRQEKILFSAKAESAQTSKETADIPTLLALHTSSFKGLIKHATRADRSKIYIFSLAFAPHGFQDGGIHFRFDGYYEYGPLRALTTFKADLWRV